MTLSSTPSRSLLERVQARRRAPRAAVTQLGFESADLRWVVTCPCGALQPRIFRVESEARTAKRAHDRAHRLAQRGGAS